MRDAAFYFILRATPQLVSDPCKTTGMKGLAICYCGTVGNKIDPCGSFLVMRELFSHAGLILFV